MIKLLKRVVLIGVVVAVVYLIVKYQPHINLPISEERGSTVSAEINDLSIWHDRIGSHTLVIFEQPLQIQALPDRDKSLKQIIQEQQAALVTNAGYYYFDEGKLYYSGLLLTGGAQISPLNTRSTTQVTHVLFWKDAALSVTAASAAQAQMQTWRDSGFHALQTGPLLIKNNQIQTDYIQNADNTNGRYLRTVVGQLLSGEKFIWVQKVPQTLMQLTENIQQHEQLKGKIDFALNLDGGSSTSLIIDDYPTTDFFVDKKLPAVLLIK